MKYGLLIQYPHIFWGDTFLKFETVEERDAWLEGFIEGAAWSASYAAERLTATREQIIEALERWTNSDGEGVMRASDVADAVLAVLTPAPALCEPTPERVERVAIAIRGTEFKWLALPELTREAYRDQARAALAALAEDVTP